MTGKQSNLASTTYQINIKIAEFQQFFLKGGLEFSEKHPQRMISGSLTPNLVDLRCEKSSEIKSCTNCRYNFRENFRWNRIKKTVQKRRFYFALSLTQHNKPPSSRNFAPNCQMIDLVPLTKIHQVYRGLRSLVQKF